MLKTYNPTKTAPLWSGGDFLPPADSTYKLGSASYTWSELHADVVVIGTSVTGDWNPTTDDTYDLGENSTPLEWKDLYIDGVAYIDTLQIEVAGVVLDNILFGIGTNSDGVIVLNSAGLAADTALPGVLIGTPDTPALAANSLIIANATADGDILIAGNDGGHSRTALFFDSSSAILYLGKPGSPAHGNAGMAYIAGDLEVHGTEYHLGLTIYEQSFRMDDDIPSLFGSGQDAKIMYETADSNAKILQFSIDESDDSGNNVPVFAFMEETGYASNYGLFDAFVEPLVCVLDNDKDSWFGITFSADDTPQLQCGGAATSIGFNANLVIGTIVIDEDSGAVTLVDMSVSATPADGTEESISFAIDGNIMLKFYSEADSAGAVDNMRLETARAFLTTNYHEFTEMAAPGAGAVNTARIYAFEGAGDALTDLCAVFQDGSIDVFAQETTEPDSPIFQYPNNTDLKLKMLKPDNKTVQFVASFPDGRDFIMREIRYPVERW